MTAPNEHIDAVAPVEVTTRYVTSVDTLPKAWAFVMSKVDRVGEDPSVEITPRWIMSVSDAMEDRDCPPRIFEVVVSGMAHEAAEETAR